MAFGALEIGKRALLASRFGLEVTSNNIANSNTPGYSRRTATFKEGTPYNIQGNFNGTGVVVDKLRTYREEFFDREIRSSLSRTKSYETDDRVIQRIESVLAEPSDLGINHIVQDLLVAFDELSLKPESVPHRENVLGLAKTFTDRVKNTNDQLLDARADAMNNIEILTRKANEIISEIRSLNAGVAGNKSLATEEAQTMIDRRELKIEELAEIGNVNVTQNKDGTVNVFINGINVVTSMVSGGELQVVESVNSITGERTAKIASVGRDGTVLNYINPNTGELASWLKHYNVTLDPLDSDGNFSVLTQFNNFVTTFAEKVNDFTMQGFGLDDRGAVPPGRAFFEPSDGTLNAGNINISKELWEQPRNIPLSRAVNEPGDSTIARQIARLADDPTFLNNSTPSEFYTNFVSRIGILGREAGQGFQTSRLLSDQLTNQRESVIGVNLDEEAINLVKFQQAFEAASRVVNTTNELLTTIVNLGR